jgi:hypothetical protein
MNTARTIGLRLLGAGLLASLSACGGGGGGGGGNPPAPTPPAATFTVSATVSGLAGSGLMLRNNGGNDTPVSANGPVAFSTAVGNGSPYAVTVQTQPTALSQTCTVSNGSGTVSGANVTNVAINCQTNNYTVSAAVSGLVGGGLTLRLSPGEDLAVSGSGLFTFVMPRSSGTNYSVVIEDEPVDFTCGVTNGTGTVTSANVSSVQVNCVLKAPEAPQVAVTSATKRYGLTWPKPARADFYRVYKTRDTDTDFRVVSDNLAIEAYWEEIGYHLENWEHLRYRVEACNVSGCASTDTGSFSPVLSTFGYFKASNTEAGDWYGLFTAISGDGNTVAIAAPQEDSGSTTINGDQFTLSSPDSGAVYVLVRDPATNHWFQQAHIKASGSQPGLAFGWGLTLSHDGNTLAVGVHTDPTGGNASGSVYVYSRTGTTWTEQAYLRASNSGQDDQFGMSVALSGDGNTLLVGAPWESSAATGVGTSQTDNNAPNSGAAYVFTRAGGAWTETTYIKASTPGNSDTFGTTVAISADGSTLAISAPGEDSDATGANGDETNSGDPDSGAVYVFLRSGASWAQQAYLKAPVYAQRPSHPASQLGSALALSGNGDTLVVSSTSEDSDAVGINGTPTSAVVMESGAAYIFARSAGNWTQQAFLKASNPDAQDVFGFSLDISDDGNIVAVGARGEASASQGAGGDQDDDSLYATGAVYSFRREGSNWTQLNYVHARDTDLGDMLGVSMGMSADGKSLIVGAYGEDAAAFEFGQPGDNNISPESGAAYIF